MIYIMSQKFLGKNIEKMVKRSEYFIIDGENYGATNRGLSVDGAISTRYSRAKGVGNLCPEITLYNQLRDVAEGKKVNEVRLNRNLLNFLEDPSFIGGITDTLSAFCIGRDDRIALFVVLPDVVWKTIGNEIATTIKKLVDAPFEFVKTQKDVKENKEILRDHLKKKEYEFIAERIKKINKENGIDRKSSKSSPEFWNY